MRHFVDTPNLPKKCTAVIYGEEYAGILQKAFDFLHIEGILLPDNPYIDPRLSGHADLSALHADRETLFLAPYLKRSAFASKLQDCGAQIVFSDIIQAPDYPFDAQLNLCVLKKHFIYSPKAAEAAIVEYLTIRSDKKPIPVKQGYSRCTVCIVDEESIITADRGIAAAAKANGLQVLLIRPGHIRLNGFSYGFIGGAAFKLSSNKLVFTGTLEAHPDRETILSFLCSRGIEPVYLTQEPVFDIGSAIPIFEN